MLHSMPDPAWNGGYQEVFDQLTKVGNLSEAIKVSGIGESGIVMEPIVNELSRIIHRLVNGTVRVGIIGLLKAGKSTFLNALLGKEFLPNSVQAQTAKEVVIIHDKTKPDGELYCIIEENPTRLAAGEREIFRKLLQLNTKARETNITDSATAAAATERCDKLKLHAPLRFLAEVDDVKLELSDTPGFGEAGAKNISKDVNITVKDMCAFVLIMNSQNMKTDSELKLLNKLKFHHPKLFSKLNRMLILVNAHTSLYREYILTPNSASISPDNLHEYVSKFIGNPEYLNETIPPEQILVFHAQWALRAREWNDTNILEEKKGKILYNEAMQMLRFVGKEEDADNLQPSMSAENVQKTISLLEPISQIQIVEEHLRSMVVKNRKLVLLESAVDDSISVVSNSLLPTVVTLIEDEHIEVKEEELKSAKEIEKVLEDLLSEKHFTSLHSSIVSFIEAHKTALHDAVEESLTNVVSNKLDYLRDTKDLDNEKEVAADMRRARETIPTAALAKLKKEWLTRYDAIKRTATDKIDNTFLNIRASFLSSLGNIKRNGPMVQDLMEELMITVPKELTRASENSAHLVPDVNSLPMDGLTYVQNKAVRNDAIDGFVREGTKQIIETEEREICSGGLFGTDLLEECTDYLAAVTRDKTVFSADHNAFKSAFDSTIQTWTGEFNQAVKNHGSEFSSAIVAAGKKVLKNILKEPQRRVTEFVQSLHTLVEKCRKNIEFFEKTYDELQKLASSLTEKIST